MLDRRIPLPEALLDIRPRCEEIGVDRPKMKSSVVLLYRAAEINGDVLLIIAKREIPFGIIWRERHGLLGRLAGTLRQVWHRGARPEQNSAGRRHARPCQREAGVERHGLLIETERPSRTGILSFFPFEEGVISREILRGLLRKPLLFARSERHVQRLGDARRDVRLDLEDVRQRGVEGLLPFRGWSPGRLDLHK